MKHSELIGYFPPEHSIADRVLLIAPDMMRKMIGVAVNDCRVFILVTQGELTVRTGGRQVTVFANSYVDILAWEPVEFVAISDKASAWCLMPNYEFTNESLNMLKPADSESFKDRLSLPLFILEPTETAVLERQLRMLDGALRDMQHYYRTEMCRTYFRSFMLEIGNIMHHKNTMADESEGVESRQDTILRSFLKLVWRYNRSEHNVDFYAGRLCLSSKHLSRVVREKLGKTPYAVIRDEILQSAIAMLRDTRMPVQEISAELHFSEMAAFCKFFKKHQGVTPTAFRTRRQH